MRRGIAGLLLVALVVGQGGCALGPNYRRPELPTPPSFREQPELQESFADLPWWEIFDDKALAALIREGLENNRDLAVAAARVEQARYLAGVERSALFPQTGYQGAGSRGNNSQFGSPVPGRHEQNDYLALLELAWEIDLWGRIRRASESARAEMLASEAFRRGVVLSLVTGIAQAYFELRELDLELEIARRTVENFTETRDLFRRQYEGGISSKLDMLRAEAALAQVAASVPDLEGRIVAQENRISVLVGRAPAPVERGRALVEQEFPPEVPAGVPSALLERRPDLIEAEQTLVAANARIGVAVANFLPRIGLTSVVGSQSGELADILASGTGFWGLIGSGAGPLLTFGRNWFSWRAAQQEAEAATAAYQQSVLVALQEISDSLTAREKLVAVHAERERAVEALSEALRIARIRYIGGLATYLEVLDAQQQLFPAELDLAQTRLDQWVVLLAIYRALGGGWNDAPDPPSVPLPLAP